MIHNSLSDGLAEVSSRRANTAGNELYTRQSRLNRGFPRKRFVVRGKPAARFIQRRYGPLRAVEISVRVLPPSLLLPTCDQHLFNTHIPKKPRVKTDPAKPNPSPLHPPFESVSSPPLDSGLGSGLGGRVVWP
jgi:hypothetical protein